MIYVFDVSSSKGVFSFYFWRAVHQNWMPGQPPGAQLRNATDVRKVRGDFGNEWLGP